MNKPKAHLQSTENENNLSDNSVKAKPKKSVKSQKKPKTSTTADNQETVSTANTQESPTLNSKGSETANPSSTVEKENPIDTDLNNNSTEAEKTQNDEVSKIELSEIDLSQLHTSKNGLSPSTTLDNKEINKWKDQYFRTLADLDNVKKRHQSEMVTIRKKSSASVLKDILPILDSFTLAQKHEQTATNLTDEQLKQYNQMKEGFLLIEKQLISVLEKHHVSKIEALNKPFDTNYHQAIAKQKKEGVAAGIVIDEVQTGYLLHQTLLRESMVIISE